jgi:serine/threonine-protein kinase RsbW
VPVTEVSPDVGAWEQSVDLAIPPSHEYLDLARMVVTTTAALDPMFPDARVSDLRLAVSEACTNAIEAHRRLKRSDAVRIHCELTEDRIEVTVTDRGGGFSPDERYELPDPGDPERLDHERGLGVDLIRAVADTVEFHRVDGGTVVRLVVQARPA